MSHKDFTLPPDPFGLLVMVAVVVVLPTKPWVMRPPQEMLLLCAKTLNFILSGVYWRHKRGEGGGVGFRREVLALEFAKCFSDLFKFEARLCREPLKGAGAPSMKGGHNRKISIWQYIVAGKSC